MPLKSGLHLSCCSTSSRNACIRAGGPLDQAGSAQPGQGARLPHRKPPGYAGGHGRRASTRRAAHERTFLIDMMG
jgi:hypothetical protein